MLCQRLDRSVHDKYFNFKKFSNGNNFPALLEIGSYNNLFWQENQFVCSSVVSDVLRIGWLQGLEAVMGGYWTSPPGGWRLFKLINNCNFRAKILKNNTKLRLRAPHLGQLGDPPLGKDWVQKSSVHVRRFWAWKNSIAHFPNMSTTKFHVSVMNLAYDQLTGCTSVMPPPPWHWQCHEGKYNRSH